MNSWRFSPARVRWNEITAAAPPSTSTKASAPSISNSRSATRFRNISQSSRSKTGNDAGNGAAHEFQALADASRRVAAGAPPRAARGEDYQAGSERLAAARRQGFALRRRAVLFLSGQFLRFDHPPARGAATGASTQYRRGGGIAARRPLSVAGRARRSGQDIRGAARGQDFRSGAQQSVVLPRQGLVSAWLFRGIGARAQAGVGQDPAAHQCGALHAARPADAAARALR